MTGYLYSVIPFLRSPAGKAVLVILSASLLVFFVKENRERHHDKSETPSRQAIRPEVDLVRKPVTVSNRQNYSKFPLVVAESNSQPEPVIVETEPLRNRTVTFAHIEATPSITNPSDGAPSDNNPSKKSPSPGTLMLCKLVNEISSSQSNGPIIAILYRDVYKGKEILFPASSRIYGAVKEGSVNGRIESHSSWKLYTPRNQEVRFSGVAVSWEQISFHSSDNQSGLILGMVGYSRTSIGQMRGKAAVSSAGRALARAGRTGIRSLGSGRFIHNLDREILSAVTNEVFESSGGESKIVTSPAGQFFYILMTPSFTSSPAAHVATSGDFEPILNQRRQLKELIRQTTR